jgi:hypothetical protein
MAHVSSLLAAVNLPAYKAAVRIDQTQDAAAVFKNHHLIARPASLERTPSLWNQDDRHDWPLGVDNSHLKSPCVESCKKRTHQRNWENKSANVAVIHEREDITRVSFYASNSARSHT